MLAGAVTFGEVSIEILQLGRWMGWRLWIWSLGCLVATSWRAVKAARDASMFHIKEKW